MNDQTLEAEHINAFRDSSRIVADKETIVESMGIYL